MNQYDKKIKEVFMPMIFEALKEKGVTLVEQVLDRDYMQSKKDYANLVWQSNKSLQQRLEMSQDEIKKGKIEVWSSVEKLENNIIELIINKLKD